MAIHLEATRGRGYDTRSLVGEFSHRGSPDGRPEDIDSDDESDDKEEGELPNNDEYDPAITSGRWG